MSLTSLEFATLILSVEFALLAWVVPAVLLARRRRVAAVDHDGASTMLEIVEAGQDVRRDALSTIFSSTYQLEGEDLEEKVNEFVAREQAFYQVMTSVYLERDSARLKEIPAELTKVISPWLRMTPPSSESPAELAALSEQNSSLHAELDETRQSMDALMAEYQAAFNKAEQQLAEVEEIEPVAQVAVEEVETETAAAQTGAAPAPVAEIEDFLDTIEREAVEVSAEIAAVAEAAVETVSDAVDEIAFDTDGSLDLAQGPEDDDAMIGAVTLTRADLDEEADVEPETEADRGTQANPEPAMQSSVFDLTVDPEDGDDGVLERVGGRAAEAVAIDLSADDDDDEVPAPLQTDSGAAKEAATDDKDLSRAELDRLFEEELESMDDSRSLSA